MINFLQRGSVVQIQSPVTLSLSALGLGFVVKMIGFGGRASKTTKSPTAAEEAALAVLGCCCPPLAFSLVLELAGGAESSSGIRVEEWEAWESMARPSAADLTAELSEWGMMRQKSAEIEWRAAAVERLLGRIWLNHARGRWIGSRPRGFDWGVWP